MHKLECSDLRAIYTHTFGVIEIDEDCASKSVDGVYKLIGTKWPPGCISDIFVLARKC